MSNTYIECPHCFATTDNDHEYDTGTYRCEDCDNVSSLEVEIERTYELSTDCELNDEDHVWKHEFTGKFYERFGCENCDVDKIEHDPQP